MKFEITTTEHQRINDWLRDTVYPDLIAKQKTTDMSQSLFAQECWAAGYPYNGASGGGLTFEFTPTGIGTVTVVRYAGGYELDVTDYDMW